MEKPLCIKTIPRKGGPGDIAGQHQSKALVYMNSVLRPQPIVACPEWSSL